MSGAEKKPHAAQAHGELSARLALLKVAEGDGWLHLRVGTIYVVMCFCLSPRR